MAYARAPEMASPNKHTNYAQTCKAAVGCVRNKFSLASMKAANVKPTSAKNKTCDTLFCKIKNVVFLSFLFVKLWLDWVFVFVCTVSHRKLNASFANEARCGVAFQCRNVGRLRYRAAATRGMLGILNDIFCTPAFLHSTRRKFRIPIEYFQTSPNIFEIPKNSNSSESRQHEVIRYVTLAFLDLQNTASLLHCTWLQI